MTAPKSPSTAPDTSAWTLAGRNVRLQKIDNMLFVAIDISNKAFDKVLTATAKGNKTIASTLGNIAIDGTSLKLGLNMYGPPPA